MSKEWPALPYADWKDTYATLHLWTQIAGKYRLIQSPWLNHSWHATFYLTSRGLTSSPIPYQSNQFEIDFDFLIHKLVIHTSDGLTESVELRPRTVADFYAEVQDKLKGLGIHIKIRATPNEVPVATPFAKDEQHASYDPEYAQRLWRILLSVDRVFKEFRSRFLGKCSPVHFFWGSFDLAVTRFSGRVAPEHPGKVPNLPDWVAKEAYSHEVSSAGFWPGSADVPFPLFYAYAYPEPSGFKETRILPPDASYDNAMREFILPYDSVRTAKNPDAVILDFLQSAYNAAADCGHWDRAALEKQ